jgi:hypothetical protein
MMTVWKFEAPQDALFRVAMPQGARVLCVQAQDGVPFMWALVDPSAPTEDRQFRTVATGSYIEEPLGTYVGTYQMHNGALVLHLFEALY